MAGARPVPPDEGLISGAEQALAGHPDFGDTGLIWLRAEAGLRFALRIWQNDFRESLRHWTRL